MSTKVWQFPEAAPGRTFVLQSDLQDCIDTFARIGVREAERYMETRNALEALFSHACMANWGYEMKDSELFQQVRTALGIKPEAKPSHD